MTSHPSRPPVILNIESTAGGPEVMRFGFRPRCSDPRLYIYIPFTSFRLDERLLKRGRLSIALLSSSLAPSPYRQVDDGKCCVSSNFGGSWHANYEAVYRDKPVARKGEIWIEVRGEDSKILEKSRKI